MPPKRLPFSIDELLERSPSPKRRRRSSESSDDHSDEELPTTSDRKFYTVTGESRHHNDRYKGVRYVSTYSFEELQESISPEMVLREIFERSINCAMELADEAKLKPDKIFITINSEILDYPMEIFIHAIDDDTINKIWETFNDIDQSNKDKDERGHIYGAPFQISLLAFSAAQLRESVNQSGGKRKHRGAGKLRLRHKFGHLGGRLRPVNHNINPNGLYRIENEDDNYCLFRAIVLLVAKATLPQQRFSEYLRDDERILDDAIDLMEALDIDQEEEDYCIEDYGEEIQRHYDELFPGTFKIFGFSDVGYYKPFYQTDAEKFRFPISLYYHEGHYDAIRNINTFFDVKYYCFHCESSCDSMKTHNMKCKIRCVNCGKVDTATGPCSRENGFWRKCDACEKTFTNKKCFDEHLLKTLKHSFCDLSKKCLDCGVIYQVRVANRKSKEVEEESEDEYEPLPEDADTDAILGRLFEQSEAAAKRRERENERKKKEEKRGHKCGHIHCKCGGYHLRNRGCYIQELEVPKEKDYRIIIFDFEATQDFQPNPKQLRYEHEVNFISATVVCTRCIENNVWKDPLAEECDVCGSSRTHAWAMADFEQTAFDFKEITDNPLSTFLEWLLYNFKEGVQAKFETLALLHFGGRYDMTLLFGELFRMGGLRPQIIRQGNKLFEMMVSKGKQVTKTIFRDTFNIMPLGLGKLIETYNLKDVEDKQFFPHLFNKVSNLEVEHANHPPPSDYLVGGMRLKKLAEFQEWYELNRDKPFVLREALADYCKSDVKILLYAVVEMRALWKELTNLDIFRSKTIASGVMKHFRTNHLKDTKLAIVPENGYEARFKQSRLATKFFQWYEVQHGVKVQTYQSPMGEKKCGSYHLDGYVERPEGQRNLAIEVHGCYWHACAVHFPDDEMICGNGQTAALIRANNEKREQYIRQRYDLEIYWECQIKEMLQGEEGMKEYFAEKFDSSAIVLRDAFFGGRVGPEKIHHVARPGHKIAYLDFQSLYPSRQYETSFPLGHPKVEIKNEYVHWTSSYDNPYCGIIKCLIEPPRNGVPVLPLRLEGDNRLLFPLCRRCAQENLTGKKDPDYSCTHFDAKDRWFVTTTTHLELDAALDAGYVVHKVYRIYTWKKWSDQIFRGYIREFLRIKIENSDWPASCKHPDFPGELPSLDDPELPIGQKLVFQKLMRERQEFIWLVKDAYDIDLRPEKIMNNPGLRYIAKLALNSLWGRFALRNNLCKTVIVDSPTQFLKYFDNYRIELRTIDQLNEEALMITYMDKPEYISEHSCSNIILSLFTTSAARVHLYKVLAKVHKAGGVIIYMDTDSIIYEYPISDDPLEMDRGKLLGQLTDEYPNHDIIEVVSGGCKNYFLVIRKKDDPNAPLEYVMRIRGITFDRDTARKLTFEEYKRQVLNLGEPEEPLALNYRQLRPSIRKGNVMTVPMTKKFRPVITKGVILGDLRVVPFGYSEPYNMEIDQLYAEANMRNMEKQRLLKEQDERIRLQNPFNRFYNNNF